MTVRDVRTRTIEHDALRDGPRLDRFGRLAPEPGAPASGQVRCSCDRCGAHLLAAAQDEGELTGHCPVCVGQRFTPVDPLVARHHVAG